MINFSDNENINKLIELEKISLMSTLDIQKNLNKQILIFVKNFMATTTISFDTTSTDNTSFYLNKATENLNKSNSNINILKTLLDLLDNIDTSNENDIKNYNNNFKQSINSIYTNTELIEKFIYEITTTDFSESENQICFENVQTKSTVTHNDDSSTDFVENTLIISDSQKKVILPYKMRNVQDILNKNTQQYNSVEDVINKLYTKPFNFYKFSPISRFKEAFKLVKEKEKGSTLKALSLALELFGNYNLHPAIITACNSLDELDIYLACLEDNTLDEFHFFDIKYEIPLALAKLTASNLGISRLAKNNKK